ncbi:MAG: hypothetical protein MUF46_02925 [Desulfobacterales bacterium]|nr:hypothetical protein [Desulfobacterales bacterium]MCU0584552.1 hypothetical protein [Desulfobacterales bacterium]
MRSARPPEACSRSPLTGMRCGLIFLAALSGAPQSTPALAGPAFKMADALVCTIETSTQGAEIGKKISLYGLTTATPKAVFENHIRSSMTRLFESDSTLVIQLVAAVSGSVDTIVIDKQSGRFAHIAAGAFPAEIHALSETGTCRSE